jgi:ATP-dependent protease ClpP protease subunit
MNIFKRATVSILVLFTFLIAPNIKGLRTVPTPPRTHSPSTALAPVRRPVLAQTAPFCGGEDGEEKKDEPLPTLARPSKLGAGEKWVHLIRFAEAGGSLGVDEDSAKTLARRVAQANESGVDVIVLEINSPGGSVDAGHAIERTIELSRAPVQCVVDGWAASMAAQFLQSCNTRMMTKRSSLLIHEPSIMAIDAGGQVVFANKAALLHASAEAELEQSVRRMRVSKEWLRRKIEHGQDYWLTWEEAVRVGAVDGVVGGVADVIASYRRGLAPVYLH